MFQSPSELGHGSYHSENNHREEIRSTETDQNGHEKDHFGQPNEQFL